MGLERRRYSRFLVHPDEAEVLVQIGDTVLTGRLADQSCNGMHLVLAGSSPAVAPGTRIWLQTPAGCTEARVIRVTQDDKEVHVGLERLLDVPQLPASQSREPLWSRLPTLVNWDARLLGAGLALVICVVLAISGAFFLFTDVNTSGLFGSNRAGNAAAPKNQGKHGSMSGMTVVSQQQPDRLFQTLLQQLPIATVVKELRLTPQQEREFRTFLQAAQRGQDTNPTSEAELARLGQAHDRMVAVLSPSQLAHWKLTVETHLSALQTPSGPEGARQILLNRLFQRSQATSPSQSNKSR